MIYGGTENEKKKKGDLTMSKPMSKQGICGPVFAMDGFERSLVVLANSSTRALTPPARPIPPMSTSTTTSISGAGSITLGQLAQSKPGGIK